jgi:Domain of unknown function (DUF4192)
MPSMTVRTPADLLASVPYLLGFHPADSAVVLALRGGRVLFAVRADLPAEAAEIDSLVSHVGAVVAEQGATAATVLGYGPRALVDPVVSALREAFAGHGVRMLEALRVADGRYWSYLCEDPACCPAEGTPYDPTTTSVAAVAAYEGHAALPDRAAVARQVAPLGGPAREAMRQATLRAEARLVELLDAAALGDLLGGRAVRRAGEAAVADALACAAAGGRLSDDEVAWLSLLLAHLPVRDHAWEQVTDDGWQVEMWADLVRRVEPEFVAAPACLLAFVSWRTGHGALANLALDRALGEDPTYSMGLLLREALDRGLPPSALGSRRPRPRRRGRSRSVALGHG